MSLFLMVFSVILVPVTYSLLPFVLMGVDGASLIEQVGIVAILILSMAAQFHITVITIIFFIYFYRRDKLNACLMTALIPWINAFIICFLFLLI
ncbi:hypothetical protein ACJJIW_19585 [Microbulbifer sp. JMSA004]|uniref:hypothetical protein n=1 Tax=unclassified Microbulbifer TaxID=2619833 RepID=UPI00403AA23B